MDDADRAEGISAFQLEKLLGRIRDEIRCQPAALDDDCDDCAEAIDPERRRVAPTATRCLTCQEAAERAQRNRRPGVRL